MNNSTLLARGDLSIDYGARFSLFAGNTFMQRSWTDLRAAILRDPAVTYLNTGSYGLTPQVVFDKANALRRLQQQSPLDFLWRRGGEYLWESRTQLADF